MFRTHETGRRLAVLTGLSLALALCTAATVAAYPVTPDGEPLHLETAATQSLAPDPVLKPVDSTEAPSTAGNAVPIAGNPSSGTDWGSAIAVAAGAGLAALALIAGSFALTNHRRRSAAVH